MDYKYIEQLLARYWQCDTTLEEERILRTFFSQDNIPVWLLPYKDLFAYQQATQTEDILSEEFDFRILGQTQEIEVVKAQSITISRRLKPLFRAAAAVAIILTIGNALQAPFNKTNSQPQPSAGIEQTGVLTVAMGGDTIKADTAKTVQSIPVIMQ